MGSGDRTGHLNFHIHFHHHHHGKREKSSMNIPKGCLAVMVGQGEDRRRFIIPIMYVNHPLFMQLLKEAEEEYGFEHKGPITIPCHVEEFDEIKEMIDKETTSNHHHHQHHNNDHQHHHRQFLCFKA